MAPEALPFDVVGGEAAEADPAALDAERDGIRHGLVHAAQHLVPGQSVVQLRLFTRGGGREVPADLRLIREARSRADRSGVGFRAHKSP